MGTVTAVTNGIADLGLSLGLGHTNLKMLQQNDQIRELQTIIRDK